MAITVDDKRVQAMFDNYDHDNLKKIFKDCVKRSLDIIKKAAENELSKHTSALDKKDKYNNTLRKGIKANVYKDNVSGIVHIMGNYKLKWFQNGTVDRYKKTYKDKNGNEKKYKGKGAYTGKMKSTNFFSTATTNVEAKVFGEMESRFNESIQKVLK